jgi:hypothetical protein
MGDCKEEKKEEQVKRRLEPWLKTACNLGNWMQLQKTSILAMKSRNIDCTIRDTTKIQPTVSIMNSRMLSA